MGRKRPGQLFTGNEAKFVAEILSGKTQNEAVVAAGYRGGTKISIASTASRLMKKKYIIEAIEKGRANALSLASVNASEVLQGLQRIAFFDIRGIVDPNTGEFLEVADLPDDIARSVTGVKVTDMKNNKGEVYATVTEYKFESRTRALEVLANIAKLTDGKPNEGDTVRTIAELVKNAAEMGRQAERKNQPKLIEA